jgi:hypothetical protein
MRTFKIEEVAGQLSITPEDVDHLSFLKKSSVAIRWCLSD